MPAKPDGKTCPHCGITWTIPEGFPSRIVKFCPQCAGWLGAMERMYASEITEIVRRQNIRYYVEQVFPATRNVAKLPDGHPES